MATIADLITARDNFKAKPADDTAGENYMRQIGDTVKSGSLGGDVDSFCGPFALAAKAQNDAAASYVPDILADSNYSSRDYAAQAAAAKGRALVSYTTSIVAAERNNGRFNACKLLLQAPQGQSALPPK